MHLESAFLFRAEIDYKLSLVMAVRLLIFPDSY